MTSHKDTKTEPKADTKSPEPKHDAKPDERQPTKRVQMQKGTDEVNHGGKSYPVPKDTGIVELPANVAEHVIKTGGASEIFDPPEPSEDFVKVRHVHDPKLGVRWGEYYEPDKNGVLKVPVAAVEDIAAHGFLPC